jgi:microcystin-dependent protein
MSEPFLGEVRLMSFTFVPRGWAACDGQLLPINQNQALFALLGTTYGGDGRTTFALPDLRGRTPLHAGGDVTLGQTIGADSVTLTQSQIPTHTHVVQATSDAATTNNAGGGAGGSLANARTGTALYGPPSAPVNTNPATVGTTGASQAHENRQPYTTVMFCIALQGIFPSQN